MSWRVKELEHFSNSIRWLPADDANAAYAHALQFDSKKHLGLRPEAVSDIERIEFEGDVALAAAWLKKRLHTQFQWVVVFGEDDAFECSPLFLLKHWQDVFLPGRDDAMAYALGGNQVLFICHEEEFEIGLVCPNNSLQARRP